MYDIRYAQHNKENRAIIFFCNRRISILFPFSDQAISSLTSAVGDQHGECLRRSDPQTSFNELVCAIASKFRTLEHSCPDGQLGDAELGIPTYIHATGHNQISRYVLAYIIRVHTREAHVPCSLTYVYPVTVYINAFLKSLRFPSLRSVVDTASGRTIPFVSRFSRAQSAYSTCVSPDKPGRRTHRPCTSPSLYILEESLRRARGEKRAVMCLYANNELLL